LGTDGELLRICRHLSAGKYSVLLWFADLLAGLAIPLMPSGVGGTRERAH